MDGTLPMTTSDWFVLGEVGPVFVVVGLN
jgi:hypothetical protein